MSLPLLQLCTFKVGDITFGLEVTRVQEVLRYQEMTPVPLAPPHIRGLLNLRGQIVMAVDLRSLIQLPPQVEGALPMNVVIEGDEGSLSLLVDTIGDVIEVDKDAFEAVPSTMKPAQRKLVSAICKLPGALLLLLAPEGLGFVAADRSTATKH